MYYTEEWQIANKIKDRTFIPQPKLPENTIYSVMIEKSFDNGATFNTGDTVKLVRDDNTINPLFENQLKQQYYCSWFRLRPFLVKEIV